MCSFRYFGLSTYGASHWEGAGTGTTPFGFPQTCPAQVCTCGCTKKEWRRSARKPFRWLKSILPERRRSWPETPHDSCLSILQCSPPQRSGLVKLCVRIMRSEPGHGKRGFLSPSPTLHTHCCGARLRCSFKPQLDPRASKRFAHVKPHYSSPAGPSGGRQELGLRCCCCFVFFLALSFFAFLSRTTSAPLGTGQAWRHAAEAVFWRAVM